MQNCVIEEDPGFRVLILTNIFPPMVGGAGAVMYNLARCSPEVFDVLCARAPFATAAELRAYDRTLPFKVARVASFSRRQTLIRSGKPAAVAHALKNVFTVMPPVFPVLLRTLRTRQYDVFCLGTALQCNWLVPVLRWLRPGAAIVAYIHGEEAPTRASIRSKIFLKHLGEVDGVIAVSRFTAERLQNFGVPAKKIVVVHNGVDCERFQPGAKDAGLAARYGLGERPVVLTLARLDRRKGQDNVLRAWPGVLREFPTAVYLIAGDGDDRERLESLAAELELTESVIFAGQVTDAEVASHYRLADVYIMANRELKSGDTEGFGLVFLEAGACGRPVIGGIAGGVPDAVDEGVTGLLVDGESVVEIEGAILKVLRDQALAGTLGRNGRRHAEEFRWEKQTSKALDAMSNFAAHRKTRSGRRG